MVTELLRNLNPAQVEATRTVDGPLLIVAGPGSGKTRVITHRIAYLINGCSIDPNRIVAVTFTNKAAREMRTRLDNLLGELSEGVICKTFHSLCVSILRVDGKKIGLDNSFVIYDDDDKSSLLKRAMEEANIDPKQYPIRAIGNAISDAKSNLLDPQAFALSRSNSYYDEIVLRVYERYESLKSNMAALDFDDLVTQAVGLLRQVTEVREKYQERYLHLLIDEFQDTNHSQYALSRLLADKHRNICVVGDPDQSIYAWRNADVGNILSFQNNYPDSKVINLEENYRSTKNIVEAAKHVISPNRNRLNNDLFSKNADGCLLVVNEGHDENEEAQWVLSEIDRLVRQEGLRFGDCAVMYRVNAQSRAMEDACRRHGVSYRLIGGVRFYLRREIKDLIAYLRVIHNRRDEISLMRIINVPPRGIGSRTIEEVRRWGEAHGFSVYESLQAISDDKEKGGLQVSLTGRAVSAIRRLMTLFEELSCQAQLLGVSDLVDLVLEKVGYREYLRGGERESEQLENVQEFRGQALEVQDLLSENPALSLEAFLESVALVSPVDGLNDAQDAVTLITLHQAKGLEFPVVFILGIEEGLLPHSRSIDDPLQVEEERRLFYVGMTRAKERLYLSRTFLRRIYGDSRNSQYSGGRTARTPSRFLRDIPRSLIEKIGNDSNSTRGDSVESDTPSIRVGDKVKHKTFGEGIVLNTIATGDDVEATIAFKGPSGVKRIMLGIAPLEKLIKKDEAFPNNE
ncbi:MAG: DNA helicase-2 / ATP-dependent DNA helicase PcrA [Chloroflexi bacterium]|jgi:DNA helicase-2/ATP-dependent DNA helicase PcrA|nr:MAG: DNA helicase-2 / ATP-dependent DNA helicase PcrA [Chloroflexota bacterium]